MLCLLLLLAFLLGGCFGNLQVNLLTAVAYLVHTVADALQHDVTGTRLAKVTITRTTGAAQTVTQTLHEVVTTVKHRPWKSPHGSPSRILTKSSTDYEAITSKGFSSDGTVASVIAKDEEMSSTMLPSTSATHCLPPCKSGVDKDGFPTKDKDAIAMIKHRRWNSPHGSPSHKVNAPPPTKTLVPPESSTCPL